MTTAREAALYDWAYRACLDADAPFDMPAGLSDAERFAVEQAILDAADAWRDRAETHERDLIEAEAFAAECPVD